MEELMYRDAASVRRWFGRGSPWAPRRVPLHPDFVALCHLAESSLRCPPFSSNNVRSEVWQDEYGRFLLGWEEIEERAGYGDFPGPFVPPPPSRFEHLECAIALLVDRPLMRHVLVLGFASDGRLFWISRDALELEALPGSFRLPLREQARVLRSGVVSATAPYPRRCLQVVQAQFHEIRCLRVGGFGPAGVGASPFFVLLYRAEWADRVEDIREPARYLGPLWRLAGARFCMAEVRRWMVEESPIVPLLRQRLVPYLVAVGWYPLLPVEENSAYRLFKEIYAGPLALPPRVEHPGRVNELYDVRLRRWWRLCWLSLEPDLGRLLRRHLVPCDTPHAERVRITHVLFWFQDCRYNPANARLGARLERVLGLSRPLLFSIRHLGTGVTCVVSATVFFGYLNRFALDYSPCPPRTAPSEGSPTV